MGHSTGCQDIMEYLTGPGHETRAPIDGGILQAPASDREAIIMELQPEIYEESCTVAQSMVAAGDGEEILPSRLTKQVFFQAPIAARRWLSLASPNHDGDDDYFSSDLTDDQLRKTFGTLPARSPLLILYSGDDEFVPKEIDKLALVKRWIGFAKEGPGKVDEEFSGVLEGASHNLWANAEEVVQDFLRRVLGFLNAFSLKPSL